MHKTFAGEKRKALEEVALELAHEGGKDPARARGKAREPSAPSRRSPAARSWPGHAGS
jgi:hypothetical protein